MNKFENFDTVDHTTEDIFACQFCNFTTTSRAGLMIHRKRKHTNYTEENFPTSCEYKTVVKWKNI